MIQQVSTLVFLTVLAALACVGLLVSARRMRSKDALRRRLGELKTDTDPLMRSAQYDDGNGLNQLLAESGLGWDASTFLTRSVLAASTGLLLGVALGSGLVAFMLAMLGGAVMLIVVRQARARRLRQCR